MQQPRWQYENTEPQKEKQLPQLLVNISTDVLKTKTGGGKIIFSKSQKLPQITSFNVRHFFES